jgi:hypothetical protein
VKPLAKTGDTVHTGIYSNVMDPKLCLGSGTSFS